MPYATARMSSHVQGARMRRTLPSARVDIAGPRPLSLIWQKDELVDWAGGGTRYRLDGSVGDRPLCPFPSVRR
ncbi:hypothetical protein [Deinococcus hopiensis]|uniref:hypothetical protein n=1 Tax=Deinococcus hopiensis TaxID=309885 RepID=UPI00111C5BC1|nr:hypothetical protein [Deinococcus hopiensis]